MAKLLTRQVALSLVLALVAGMSVFAPVFAYTYRAPVSVSENVSTSYDMLPVLWDSANEWMADNGFMNSSANDTRVQTLGGLNKPWMVADNKTLTAIPVPANSQTNLYFVTGESEASVMDIITGGGGYLTVADDADLEPSDNFSLEMSGYFDTSASAAGANITSKPDAFRLFNGNPSGNITAIIEAPVWTTPTGHNDPSNDWADEAKAYDDNLATFALCEVANPGWGGYLEFDVTQTMVGSVRYYCTPEAGGTAHLDEISVDVYYDAGWHNIYEGELFFNVWAEVSLGSPQVITGARAKFYNDDTFVWDLYFKEFDVGLYPIVTATGISSGEHEVVIAMDSPFLGLGIDAGSDILPMSGNLVFNAPLWQTECDADPFTSIDNYALSCDVQEAVWSSDGYTFDEVDDYIEVAHDASQLLTTGGTIEAWIRPNTLGETSGRILDKTIDSAMSDGYAMFMRGSGAGHGEPGFIINSGVMITCTGNDWIAWGDWAHVVATWDNTGLVSMYVNGVAANTPSISADPAEITTANAIRIGNRSGATDRTFDGDIGEVRIYSTELTPAEVLQNYNATKSKYISGDIYTYSTLASVSDNANDWIFCQSAACPYTDNISLSVGGVRQLYFAPNDIIDGTTLPDRESNGGSNDGTIVWGSNPAGVEVSVGSMSSVGQPVVGGAEDTSTSNLLPTVGGTDWRPTPAVSAELQANPMRPIVTAISDNTTLSEYQVWVWLGIVFVVFITVLVGANVRGHHLITGIATSAAVILMVVWAVFPMFALVVVALAIFGGAVSERTSSL